VLRDLGLRRPETQSNSDYSKKWAISSSPYETGEDQNSQKKPAA
jgi:hypothetical protein